MKKLNGLLLFSASDLNGFLGCKHSTFLDLMDMKERLPRAQDSAQDKLIQERGIEHEKEYLESLKRSGLSVVEVPDKVNLTDRVRMTAEMMSDGPDIIFQAASRDGQWHGYADFLRKVDRPSKLGSFSYEAVDIKLTKNPKPKFAIQLCLYSEFIEKMQGTRPQGMSLVLGDLSQVDLRFDDFAYYFAIIKRQFEKYVAAPPFSSKPLPCGFCEVCKWRDYCGDQWIQNDHLSQIANIRRADVLKFEKAGIPTLAALAKADDNTSIFGMTSTTVEKLRAQAQLQFHKRETGEDKVEILDPGPGRGFTRIPMPAEGDLFFDMEGDPLYPDGLEYLFGFYFIENGKPIFKPSWAHDHKNEKLTLQKVIDFIVAHLKAHPDAHIYHYNHYEETALKRLASRYATRESELDGLLRSRKLVDLFKVVREAIRISEPKYSIKNLEVFYMEKREAEVATAGDSIVVYEEWRQNPDDHQLLQNISDYNEDDCRSTLLLRDWLLTLRSADMSWFNLDTQPVSEERLQAQQEAEENRISYLQNLTSGHEGQEFEFRELVAQLLEFHRREAKPQWWAMFDRQERTHDELVEDADCLGGLKADPSHPPYKEKRSFVYTYQFPAQVTKLKKGSPFLRADNLESAGTIVDLNMEDRTIKIKKGPKGGPLPDALSITPPGPIDNRVLKGALYRFADAIIAGSGKYQALTSFLRKEKPVVTGHKADTPIISAEDNSLQAIAKAVGKLQDSFLFIQGPPGAGKTFTSSHVILELLRRGKRIGISSNSHKAINNLLDGIEKAAQKVEVPFTFKGQKKCSTSNPDSVYNGEIIKSVSDSDGMDPNSDVIAGTAWLFAREEYDETLDYLFIDEAGQVSLANLVAMGLSAKNIVLVGDQMQLGQPIQGTHPGSSGMSILDYLLEGKSTIPADRGIFLGTTWRMHENVCQFISDAVYEGRLRPEKGTQNQTLILADSAHTELKPNGIRFIEAKHEGCSQKSEAEGRIIQDLVASLLQQQYKDRAGQQHAMSPENILVVTPYNVQVNYLTSILPEEVKVGTVDKFQGQEAEVVIISMVTSGAEDLPRDIEFLYSKNRLNVAISRARTLALIVASPNLLEISCHTVEQLELVNTLCWAKILSDQFIGETGQVEVGT